VVTALQDVGITVDPSVSIRKVGIPSQQSVMVEQLLQLALQ
jgi:hypothetical protein